MIPTVLYSPSQHVNRRIRQVSSKQSLDGLVASCGPGSLAPAADPTTRPMRSARDHLLLTDVALEFNFKGVSEVKPERLGYITGTIKQPARPPDQ